MKRRFAAGAAASIPLCFWSVSLNATVPIGFGDWAATSGNISTACPAGLTCDTVAQSTGYVQRVLTQPAATPGGADTRYFQSIVLGGTETGTALTLPFSSESFVRQNPQDNSPAIQGLAARTILNDSFSSSSVSSSLGLSTILYRGWADTSSTNEIESSLSISESRTANNSQFSTLFDYKANKNAATGSPIKINTTQSISESTPNSYDAAFDTDFSHSANVNLSGVVTGHRTDVSQFFQQKMGKDQPTSSSGGGGFGGGWGGGGDSSSGSTSAYDRQGFTRREVGGDMLTTSGTLSLSTSPTISFSAGQTISVIWGGQVMNHWEGTNGGSNPMGYEDLAGRFQVYQNHSTAAAPIRHFAFGQTAAVNWNSVFGSAPTMPTLATGDTGVGSDGGGGGGWGGGGDSGGSTSSTGASAAFEAVALDVDTTAPASSPFGFSGWTVSNGVISASCVSGFACSQALADSGFFQRTIRDAAGKQYIHSIVTDEKATGAAGTVAYSSEIYVPMAGQNSTGAGGLLALQLLETQGGGHGLADRTILRSGVFDTPSLANVELYQTIAGKVTSRKVNVVSDFKYMANTNEATKERTGFKLGMEQTLEGSYKLIPSISTSGTDFVKFVRREVAGDMQTTSGSTSGSGGGGSGWGGGSSGTGSVSWKPGDDIRVTWIGEAFDIGQNADFGYQSYDNLSDSSSPTRMTDRDNTGPYNWYNPPFGTKPTMPVSAGGGGGGWGGGGGFGW